MGWNPLETLSDIGNAALNIGVNTVTGGLIGYDPNEGLTANAGATSRLINEASGRNAAREKEYLDRVANDAAAAQQKLIDDQNEQARQADVNASSSARAIRSSARATGGYYVNSSANSDERDFLGL